jgi:hypothetical protein
MTGPLRSHQSFLSLLQGYPSMVLTWPNTIEATSALQLPTVPHRTIERPQRSGAGRMAPAFGTVITTPERRGPTASAVARPVNKVPARRAVIAIAAKRRALRASASGEQLRNEREDRSRKAETSWARFTRAGPAFPDAPRMSTYFCQNGI